MTLGGLNELESSVIYDYGKSSRMGAEQEVQVGLGNLCTPKYSLGEARLFPISPHLTFFPWGKFKGPLEIAA